MVNRGSFNAPIMVMERTAWSPGKFTGWEALSGGISGRGCQITSYKGGEDSMIDNRWRRNSMRGT